jgi:hypothetical protein
MERIDAFKIVVKIKRIVEEVTIYVEDKTTIPPLVICELNTLGEMATTLEAYALMTQDKGLIDEVGKIKRDALHRVVPGWDIDKKTAISVAFCIRSLYNIANMQNSTNKPQPDIVELQPPHFTQYITSDGKKKLFEGLTKVGLLPKDTDYNHFNFVFGGTTIPDNEKPFEPLKWFKAKQLLRELLEGVKTSDMKISEVERQVPSFFVDDENKPLSLAKDKKVPNDTYSTYISDLIKDLHNTHAIHDIYSKVCSV